MLWIDNTLAQGNQKLSGINTISVIPEPGILRFTIIHMKLIINFSACHALD